MLTFEEAKEIAISKLKEINNKTNVKVALLDESLIHFKYGYVFFYQTEDYIRTRDEKYLGGGNAPLIVDKNTGNAFFTGTGKDINEYIEIYIDFKEAVGELNFLIP